MNNDSCHDAALLRLSKPGRHWETGNWRLFITGLSNIGPLRKPNGSWGDLMQKCIEWEHVQYSNLFIIYIYISICNINGFIYRHRFQHLSSITSTNDGIYTYIYICIFLIAWLFDSSHVAQSSCLILGSLGLITDWEEGVAKPNFFRKGCAPSKINPRGLVGLVGDFPFSRVIFRFHW